MIEESVLKADMHLHSRFSTRPSEWVLRRIGCAESYSEPVYLYKIAKERGMDFVTITDHNTISGSLEIAHLNDTFVSEEITTYFPEDKCKLHVLAYDITEAQHEDISRLRENVFDLVDYFHKQGIVNAIAHPLYSLNDHLSLDHLETILVLFKNFEINGTRDAYQNGIVRQLISGITPSDIERFSTKHGVEPPCPEPWFKNIIGGSDDHSSMTVANTYTAVKDVKTKHEFLQGIVIGKSDAKGKNSSPKTMAHNIYSIAYQFYRNKFSLDRYLNKEMLITFADRALTNRSISEDGTFERILSAFANDASRRFKRSKTGTLKSNLRFDAREIIMNNHVMKNCMKGKGISGQDIAEIWFQFVNQLSEKILKRSANSIFEGFWDADIFDIFQTIGSAGSLYTMLSPYFVSYYLFTKDRAFCRRCSTYFKKGESKNPDQDIKIAHFTDTLHEVNGVALTIKMEARIAEKTGKQQKVIICGPEKDISGAVNFIPVGVFEMPEYPELKIFYPPFLKMLEYCYEAGFTHIHSATPGPVGLAALAIARILKLPIFGTYHTALPQYAKLLTDDYAMEDLMWKYSIWYYNQMDVVYVPSRSTGLELEARGIQKDKIRYYSRGVDVELFHPSKRNGFLGSNFHVKSENLKILYVGRISKEKDLDILSGSYKQLSKLRKGIHLIIVGDGPYLKHLQKDLEGFPVTFTGVLSGEDLAQTYASCDIFAFPSRTDTFGNVVLEAQASGLPVVITNEGGPRENIVPHETGLEVPGGNSDAFRDALLELIDHPERLRLMGRKARKYMESRSFESAFQKLWDSYTSYNPGVRC